MGIGPSLKWCTMNIHSLAAPPPPTNGETELDMNIFLSICKIFCPLGTQTEWLRLWNIRLMNIFMGMHL